MNPKVLALLESLESEKLIHRQLWNISWETAEYLHKMILENKPKVILEVGTSNGFSGIWLASAAATYGGELWTIESSPKRIPLAQENFKNSGLENIHMIRGHAPEVFDQVPGIIDFAFLDATKEEYILFYEALKGRMKSGGVIVADNVISHRPSLVEYLDVVRAEQNSSLIDIGTGLEVTILS